jgi:hypothetical protein
MRVAGLVESDTLVPLAGANVTLLELNATVRSDDRGNFAFPPVAARVYTVEARMAGFLASTLVARPETNPGALDFVLQRTLPVASRQDTFHFRGTLECAAEAFIYSGACDGLAPVDVFKNQTRFDFPLARGWKTTVVDLVFDPSSDPGLDGMRLVVRGRGQPGQQNDDPQYGIFHGSKPFTTRLEPGGSYPDATAPMTGNVTAFILEVYPQGQAWHQACDPTGLLFGCAAGVGGGLNIGFDLYATVFYVTPAPPGYTLRTDA